MGTTREASLQAIMPRQPVRLVLINVRRDVTLSLLLDQFQPQVIRPHVSAPHSWGLSMDIALSNYSFGSILPRTSLRTTSITSDLNARCRWSVFPSKGAMEVDFDDRRSVHCDRVQWHGVNRGVRGRRPHDLFQNRLLRFDHALARSGRSLGHRARHHYHAGGRILNCRNQSLKKGMSEVAPIADMPLHRSKCRKVPGTDLSKCSKKSQASLFRDYRRDGCGCRYCKAIANVPLTMSPRSVTELMLPGKIKNSHGRDRSADISGRLTRSAKFCTSPPTRYSIRPCFAALKTAAR
jgi:hypothetical protein